MRGRVVLAVLTTILLTGALSSVDAAAAPSPAALLRAGLLAHTHGAARTCLHTVHGKRVLLGCQSWYITSGRGGSLPMVTPAPTGYTQDELARAYNLPADTVGSNGMVAIVGIGAYPNLEPDLAVYRSTMGLPPCTVANGCLKIVDYHGGPPLAPKPSLADVEESYAEETALDVQMASAACPTCKITMVQIPMNLTKLLEAASLGLPGPLANDFGTAVKEAVSLGARAVSMSYGLPNGAQGSTVQSGAPAQALHQPGVAILASSGDSGYTGNQQTFPAEDRWVISVGGTSMHTSDGGQTFTQSAWGSMFTPSGSTSPEWVGAGSGCVPQLAPALGQPASVAANCKNHRAVSDVSADADPYTGVAVYDSYFPSSGTAPGWLVFGGTSASSPYVAGLFVRAGVPSTLDGPNTMYAAPAGTITDVVGGSNAQGGAADCSATYTAAVCTGVPGWDGPTGVGVPNGLGAF